MVAFARARQARWAGLLVVCLLVAAAVVDGKEWAKGDTPSPPDAALLAGARNGENAEALKKHLEFGATIDCKSEHGWTPLITAILQGKTLTAEALVLSLRAACACTRGLGSKILSVASRALLHNCPDCASMQIEMGASLTEVDQDGNSPLHLALRHNHDEVRAIAGRCSCVIACMTCGADVCTRNAVGAVHSREKKYRLPVEQAGMESVAHGLLHGQRGRRRGVARDQHRLFDNL